MPEDVYLPRHLPGAVMITPRVQAGSRLILDTKGLERIAVSGNTRRRRGGISLILA